MLESSDGKQLIEDVWNCASAKVQLPDHIREQFYAPHGSAMPLVYDNRRSYHRFYMRGKSLLTRGETTLGVYTVDVSRQGVGFLSPVPLLPKELVELQLPTTRLRLEMARCRRLGEACFVCGARFAKASEQVLLTK